MVRSVLKAPLPPTVLHDLTPIQIQELHDWSHRFYVNSAGRRSRKTLIYSRKVLLQAMRRRVRVFQGAPTRPQAKAIFWEPLKANTRALWAQKPNESELFVRLLNGSEVHVVGLDRPQRTEGQPWDGMHVTEVDDLKPGTWEANLRPLLSDTNGFAYLDGVPEGRGLIYDMALRACDSVIPKTEPGKGNFRESKLNPGWCWYHWFSSDVLPAEEIEAARNSMDEKIFRQEYEGSFEAFDGLAYHGAHEANYIDGYKINPKEPIIVGMDFNYSPMCSVLLQKTIINGKPKVVAFKANAFQNCSTEAACQRIIDETGSQFRYIVYYDATAKDRHSHGVGETDLAIIKTEFGRSGGVWLRARSANPKRKDRLNAVNAMLRNAAGEARLLIVRSQCRPLVNDFEKCGMEEFLNGHFKDPNLGHASDGLGYFLEYDYSITGGDYSALTRM